MWRPAHGATSRPGPCRPASGYGRALGRPGPPAAELHTDDVRFDALVDWVTGDDVEAEQEAPASLTP